MDAGVTTVFNQKLALDITQGFSRWTASFQVEVELNTVMHSGSLQDSDVGLMSALKPIGSLEL